MSLADWLADDIAIAIPAIPAIEQPNEPAARPLIARRRGSSTPDQERELRTLIQLVLADAPNEYEETVTVALADPVAALTCFRALAKDAEEHKRWMRAQTPNTTKGAFDV